MESFAAIDFETATLLLSKLVFVLLSYKLTWKCN
jgi:hypothetical protein